MRSSCSSCSDRHALGPVGAQIEPWLNVHLRWAPLVVLIMLASCHRAHEVARRSKALPVPWPGSAVPCRISAPYRLGRHDPPARPRHGDRCSQPDFLRTMILVGVPAKAVMTGHHLPDPLQLLLFGLLCNPWAARKTSPVIMLHRQRCSRPASYVSRRVERTGRTEAILFWGTVLSGAGLMLVGLVRFEADRRAAVRPLRDRDPSS